jgi:sugar O-acyltransferase (sialic acid O-acetyltransferase NeuD family)
MNQRLILVGGGGFARELINWIESSVNSDIGQKITGFLDDNPKALQGFSGSYNDTQWIATIDNYIPEEGDKLIMAIGDPVGKLKVATKLKQKGAEFATFIHTTAVVARSASLGEGVVICPHALVSADVELGCFVMVNCLSSIGHDVVVGQYSTLSGHVDLTGYVQVGEGVFFGTGAKVIPKIKIGAGAKIGAGTTIMRNVPEKAVMYTTPAKRL